MLRKYKEAIIPIVVVANTSSYKETLTPEPGQIIGCMIYKGEIDNVGFVRASVKDSSGQFLSELQSIENYRSRDAKYYEGFKPLHTMGGKPLTFEIIATEVFGSDFKAELILVYAPEDEQNC